MMTAPERGVSFTGTWMAGLSSRATPELSFGALVLWTFAELAFVLLEYLTGAPNMTSAVSRMSRLRAVPMKS